MKSVRICAAVAALLAMSAPAVLAAEETGRITGVGGIFVKSKDPKALMAWYRDVLGIKLEPWGGAALSYTASRHPAAVYLNAFRPTTHYMDPSPREFMLNFVVDDLPAFLARLTAKGVPIVKRDDSDPSGKFAWILDPDGTKIELYQPNAEAAASK